MKKLLDYFELNKIEREKIVKEYEQYTDENKSIFFLILLTGYEIKNIINFFEVLLETYYYKYEQEKNCVICYKKNIFLHSFDCHHRCLCKDCLRILVSKKMNCPICRHKFEYTTMDFIESCVTILNNYSLNSLTHIPVWLFESDKFEERIVKEFHKNGLLQTYIPEKYTCKTSKWWTIFHTRWENLYLDIDGNLFYLYSGHQS